MKIHKSILLLLLISFSLFCHAQQTLIHKGILPKYQAALELYENKKYSAAQKLFYEVTSMAGTNDAIIAENARYYSAICALELTNNNVKYLISTFIKDHPENPNVTQAQYKMANFYFKKNKYRYALKWYEKVDKSRLEKNQLHAFYFKTGFCHYAQKDYDKADKKFYEILNNDDFYGPLALYFYSHIKYLNQQYQTALEGFLKLQDNKIFAGIVPFYITQIYYFQDRYEEIINYAPPLLDSIKNERTLEVGRIIGEAYYQTDNYKEALPYFEEYMEKSATLSDMDFYKLGLIYYYNERYNEAASYFEEVVGVEDSLSQNATYHLADSYLKTGRKKKAKTAFGTAAQYDFYPSISENALFNYAKLCFELDYSPFNEAINSFNKFIGKYPNSSHIDDAYEYVLDAVLSTQNYPEAMHIIENMPARTPEINEAYQRLAYFRGLELFNDLKYEEAIQFFDKSLEYKKHNETIKSLALYWKADALYRQKRFKRAIDVYKQFLTERGALDLEEYGLAHYNLGYAYFKQKSYDEAGKWFRKYILHAKDNTESKMLCDAYNRLGDCYFIKSEFAPALQYYSQAAEAEMYDMGYAIYQKAISQGRLKQFKEKINTLNYLKETQTETGYSQKAYFEIAKTYHANLEMPDSAIYFYKYYVGNFPKASQIKSALSSLANLHYNNGNYQKSLETYKSIIAKFPGTGEAGTAQEMIRNIYMELNNPDAYVEYAETEGATLSPISEFEKDSLKYKTAEKLFMDEKIADAIKALGEYIDQYPHGNYALEANFYKAECHFSRNEKEKALEGYAYVSRQNPNPYTEESLLKAAGISYELEDFEKAYKYYQQLETQAESNSRLLIALLGQMRSANNLENHSDVISAATALLKSEKITDAQTRESRYKLAKAYMALNKHDAALEYFNKLAGEVKSYEGAEATYSIALIRYQQGKDSIAENIIFDFAEANSPHRYWLAKSFILMADIYMERGDFFPARHTLQNVLDNYGNNEDGIKEEIREKLNALEKLEQASQEKKEKELQYRKDSIENLNKIDIQEQSEETEETMDTIKPRKKKDSIPQGDNDTMPVDTIPVINRKEENQTE